MELEKIINKVIQGDSIEKLRELPDNSIDFIFVDPPYFMQTEGVLLRVDGNEFSGVQDHWDKFESLEDYDKFSLSWLQECKRVLKNNGSIAVIGSFQNIYRLGFHMQNLGFWIINDIIWKKTNPVPNFAGTRFVNAHETILLCSKSKKSKINFNYHTMKYLNNNKQQQSVWELPLCTGKERLKNKDGVKLHSTQKPLQLLIRLILAMTKPKDLVLDPFFGTGTTGAAAKILGRNFIGIEKEALYCKAATERIKNTSYVDDPIYKLELEKKPPKVSMAELIKFGLLEVGQKLFSKNKDKFCTLQENGYVSQHQETPVSIHKMSAKFCDKKSYNGWSYFYIFYNNDFILIDKLRYIYEQQNRSK